MDLQRGYKIAWRREVLGLEDGLDWKMEDGLDQITQIRVEIGLNDKSMGGNRWIDGSRARTSRRTGLLGVELGLDIGLAD